MQLTNKQADAINHADGNLQLIACAGSGKTEVVAQHITKLLIPLAEGGLGLKPANVVAFTAKAFMMPWQNCISARFRAFPLQRLTLTSWSTVISAPHLPIRS